MNQLQPRKKPVTYEFRGRDCVLQIGWSQDLGLLSMVVLDKETRAELAVVSVGVDEVKLRNDEVVIRGRRR